MKGNVYEGLIMEIIAFSTPDIITTSTTSWEGDNHNNDTTLNYP